MLSFHSSKASIQAQREWGKKKRWVFNIWRSRLLTNAGVPPEHVPVKDVEGEVSEATRDLAVKVFPVEWTAGKEHCD